MSIREETRNPFLIRGARNSHPGPNHNEFDKLLEATPGWPDQIDLIQVLLDTLGKFGIRKCSRVSCVARKHRMASIAPPITTAGTCWWGGHLRDWALVTASCKAAYGPHGALRQGEPPFECVGHDDQQEEDDDVGDTQRCSNGFKHTRAAIYFCIRFLEDLGKYHPQWLQQAGGDGVNVFELCRLLMWISRSWDGRRLSPKIQTILRGTQLSIPEVRSAILQLPHQHVCQSRLWKLAEATDWGICALPSLLDALGRFELSSEHLTKHQDCNAQTCLLSDVNATRIEQLHVCHHNQAAGKRKCAEIICPGDKLNALQNDKVSGAWAVAKEHRPSSHQSLFSLFDRSPANRKNPSSGVTSSFVPLTQHNTTAYLAISHVWSDGTGVGLKQPGHVNECLFTFFSQHAAALGCAALWWDTICVPTEREQRAQALRRMHRNFAEARHTLVHDAEVAAFAWRDDGSPCLALALSTWFTRGWTALELYASASVKVLFADGCGGHVIKDLDEDVLASEWDAFAHPAWIDVSAVIKQVRSGEFWRGTGRPISHILHILNSRYTCWSQDRLLIAGLMADMGRTSNVYNSKTRLAAVSGHSQSASDLAENTKRILKSLEFITQSSLLHGKVTITASGPWSWCPLSFFDLSLPSPSEVIVELQLEGDHEGCLLGTWYATQLQADDIPRLKPVYEHLAILVRIQEALGKWKSQWLLAPWGPSMPSRRDRYLLVSDLGCSVEIGVHTLQKCAYVGTLAISEDATIFGRMKRRNILIS